MALRGGVVISYRDIDRTYEPIKIFIKHNHLFSIIDKLKKQNFAPLSELVFSKSSFKFTKTMYLENPEIMNKLFSEHEQRCNLESNIFNKLENFVFFSKKPNDSEQYVQIYGRKDNERKYMWIKKKYIQESKNFDKYTVMLPASNGSGIFGEVLSTPLIRKPLIGHTTTFLTIGCFETESEALNCLKYIKTKFARTMLGALKITQHNSKETWKYVPKQIFSLNSDIDWTRTIKEIDGQLYRKYNLSEEEKEFIESNVRPMND